MFPGLQHFHPISISSIFWFQCPNIVVTEAPLVQIPTPIPTVGEQKRGPQVNCSCPAGDKVKSQLLLSLSLSSFHVSVGIFSLVEKKKRRLYFYCREMLELRV